MTVVSFLSVFELTSNYDMRNEYDVTFQIETMGQISGSVTVIHSYVYALDCMAGGKTMSHSIGQGSQCRPSYVHTLLEGTNQFHVPYMNLFSE